MRTPILETDRLVIRPICYADAEAIFQNWATDPEVAKFMRWSIHESVDVTKVWLKEVEENQDNDKVYDWGFVLKENQMLIGSGGLYWKEDKQCFELGYNIMKKYWNQGLTTEAAREMARFAKEDIGVKELFCCYAKENIASGKVMEKVGFRYVKDGSYSSFDQTRTFETREYKLVFE
jgi:Acetyltransferases, including N-acetylases of ribosomal proteins